MARDAQMLERGVCQRPLGIACGVSPWPNMLFRYVI
jgi:hypothetical protein